MSKTYMAKASEISRKWYIVDAAGVPLGRLASQVAAVLRGKNKPTFTPHLDCGDHVIVINCDQAVLTGKKLDKKIYSYYTGHVGGKKEIPYRRMMEEKSDLAVYHAIKGMLPKNSLGKNMIKKLRVYKDDKHNHQAQQPEVLKLV